MSSIFTFYQSKTLVNISKAFHLFGSLGERGLLPAPLSLSDPPVRYKGKIFFFFFLFLYLESGFFIRSLPNGS